MCQAAHSDWLGVLVSPRLSLHDNQIHTMQYSFFVLFSLFVQSEHKVRSLDDSEVPAAETKAALRAPLADHDDENDRSVNG